MLEPNEKIINTTRMKNPLASFSNYTYSLTLAMFDPEGYNYYIKTGDLPSNNDITGNFYVISQSGGINNTKDKRALPSDLKSGINQGLDIYLDNLNFTTYLVGHDGSKTSTTSTTFTFDLVEPIGFTLLTRLANLSDHICNTSTIIKNGTQTSTPSLYQQKYVLIIKFYGYDVNGNVVQQTSINSDSGYLSNDKYAFHSRIFPLTVKQVHFKISGKATTYSFEAESPNQRLAFGSKRGILNSATNIEGQTVGDIIGDNSSENKKSLMGWLNQTQNELKINNNISEKQLYNVIWVDNKNISDIKVNDIKNSSLFTSREFERETSGMSNSVNTTLNVTVKSGSNARTTNPVKTINIPYGTPIVSVIDNIILQSKYIAGTLSKRIDSAIESKTGDSEQNKLTWYTIKPIVELSGRDNTTKDWVCNITYEIMPFEVPYVKSQYVTEKASYYGPVKRYDYIFMGSNTEVIDFSMTYNNLFYVAIPTTTTSDSTSKKTADLDQYTPRAIDNSAGSDPNGGSINKQKRLVESVRANLNSIGDTATAEIKIIGDPDFIMSSIGHKTLPGSFSYLYSKDGSISPYGGQIFIEINFKIAEDYKSNGLLDVDNTQTVSFYNDKIQEKIKPNGLIFLITSVSNTFSRGKFEQQLSLRMAPLSNFIKDEKVDESREYDNEHENVKLQRQQQTRENQLSKTNNSLNMFNYDTAVNAEVSNQITRSLRSKTFAEDVANRKANTVLVKQASGQISKQNQVAFDGNPTPGLSPRTFAEDTAKRKFNLDWTNAASNSRLKK